MGLYRYVGGGQTSIGDRGFDFVGQQGEFTEEQFLEVVLGGGVFIPEESFQKIEISLEDLTRLQWYPENQPEPELASKIEQARSVFREIYALARAGRMA